MTRVLAELTGGDRRSIGKSNAVVRSVLADPGLLTDIIDGLSSDDRLVRMRCADVAEKVSARIPGCLRPHAAILMVLAESAPEPELRWHLAQMLPRLGLDARKRRTAASLLFRYLRDDSHIVQTCALQALVEFAQGDAPLLGKVRPIVDQLSRIRSGALGARARKLRALLRKRQAD